MARAIQLQVDGRETWLDGANVTSAIRSPEATAAASIVAQIPDVRTQLVELQRQAAHGGDYVCEGRDQGTVVFPQAEVKFYITAAAEVRAERRRQELAAKGEQVAAAELLAQQAERDRRDQARDIAPLRPADDALQIDTTRLSTDDVIDRMERHVRNRLTADACRWRDPPWIARSQVLLDSYARWLGRELIPRSGSPETDSARLFHAPFVVVAHGTEADPILDYANLAALDLWATNLDTLLRLPSRQTAEPMHRDERARMLEQTRRQGYIDDYQGIRISTTGRRFRIQRATVWNLLDAAGQHAGQAATFSDWEWLAS